MRELTPKEPTFDLGDFRRRAARVQRRLDRSYATLSKRLFTSARTLPELMDRSEPDETRTFPALHRLLLADRRLRQIEQNLLEADTAAARRVQRPAKGAPKTTRKPQTKETEKP
jgi:hypothetical protein